MILKSFHKQNFKKKKILKEKKQSAISPLRKGSLHQTSTAKNKYYLSLQQNLNTTANGGFTQIFAMNSNGCVDFLKKKGSDNPRQKCHFTKHLILKVGRKITQSVN